MPKELTPEQEAELEIICDEIANGDSGDFAMIFGKYSKHVPKSKVKKISELDQLANVLRELKDKKAIEFLDDHGGGRTRRSAIASVGRTRRRR